MTKERPALTFEAAIVRMADVIDFKAMSKLIDKSVRTIQDYTDHDTPTGISLHDAFLIEAEYRRQGGRGAPIHDCWRARAAMFGTLSVADSDALQKHLVAMIKEGGDAIAAVVMANRPGASFADFAIARKELGESIAEQTATLTLIEEKVAQPP